MTRSTPQFLRIRDERRTGPRVLIVRLSAIGDCVQTMPLACAVRRLWPDCQLTWAVESPAAELVRAQSAIDSVLVLPRGFAKSPAKLWTIRKLLRPQCFDICFDPQGLTKSGIVAWLSGSRRRIGFARPAARELNPWFQTELVESRQLLRVERYLELAAAFGTSTVDFGLTIPGLAFGPLEQLLANPALRRGFVALNPGAGWDSKRWPVESHAAVAKLLASRGVSCVVTWGGRKEQAWAEQIVTLSSGAAVMAPPTSLLELAAILKHARFYVGSDTGPLHLAAALGTRCVALFGSSDHRACGPYGTGHICLQEALDESPDRKRAGADNWAMRRIAPEHVLSACERILASGHAAAA